MNNTLLNKAAQNARLFLPLNMASTEELKNHLRAYPLSWEILAGESLYPIEEKWLAPQAAKLVEQPVLEEPLWLQVCFAACGVSEEWTEEQMPTVRMRQAFNAMNDLFVKI